MAMDDDFVDDAESDVSFLDDEDPVDSSRVVTVEYDGRKFQKAAIEDNVHFYPADDAELERLLTQHKVLRMAYNDQLILCPVANPLHILDLGAGTCSWAVDVARQYPQATIRCVDYSDIVIPRGTPDRYRNGHRLAPDYAPPMSINFDFDDLNEPLRDDYDNTFDLVNSMFVAGGIDKDRWDSYVDDVYRVLKPGGWVQFFEIYPNAQSYTGRYNDASPIRKWSQMYLSTMEKTRDPRIGMSMLNKMQDSGFVSLADRSKHIPLCPWDTGPEKELGAVNHKNAMQFFYTAALWPFTRGPHASMSLDEFKDLVKGAQADASVPENRPYFQLYVQIGQKPFETRRTR